MLSLKELLEYDNAHFDIYLKFLLIQLRTEIEPVEVSKSGPEEGSDSEGDEKTELTLEEKERLEAITKGLASSKYCFLFKMKSKTCLISKVHVQGVVVYKDSKENRIILGRTFACL